MQGQTFWMREMTRLMTRYSGRTVNMMKERAAMFNTSVTIPNTLFFTLSSLEMSEAETVAEVSM